jgi:hypothetical protein
VEAGAHASRRLAAGGWLIIAAAVAVPGSSASGAEDTAECWRNFFRTQGIEHPLGEIAAFSFLGHRLHVPGAYLWRGLPRTELAEQGAVWLMAWGPQLAPVTARQANDWFNARPTGRHVVRMTMFGHPNFLHGQALLDAMTRDDRYESRDGERDAHGFTVLRLRRPTLSGWGEIYISPQGPEEMFHCTLDGQVPNPGCTAQRWIGGPFRVEIDFRKSLITEFPAISASSAGFFRCALGPHGVPGQVWPAR